MQCLWKQCRSRSVGFWRSQLIWIYTVCHCEFVSTTWIQQSDWLKIRSRCGNLIYLAWQGLRCLKVKSKRKHYHMGCIQQKSTFEDAQNTHIQICLHKLKVSSWPCSKYRPGLFCSFIHSVVSNDSVSGQQRPWPDYADAQADLVLFCLHMPENKFSHGAADIIISSFVVWLMLLNLS